MRRILFFAAVLALAFACDKNVVPGFPAEELEVENGGGFPILFSLSEEVAAKSGLDVDVHEDSPFRITYESLEPVVYREGTAVKVGITNEKNLSVFYLNTTKGPSGSETIVSANMKFEGNSGYIYYCRSGLYWPVNDHDYHFYASNVPLQETSSTYNLVTCEADKDIVWAYNGTPVYQQQNELKFNHVYGRIGNVSIVVPTGFNATFRYAVIEAPKSGIFNVETGKWYSNAGIKTIYLKQSNDVWIVPGEYEMSVMLHLSDGTTTSDVTRRGTVLIEANRINHITVSVQ